MIWFYNFDASGVDMIGIRLNCFPTKSGHNNVVSLQNQIVYERETAEPKLGAGLCCVWQKAVSTCGYSLKKKKK